MRIEELEYNEAFWIVLKRVLNNYKKWTIEYVNNQEGRIAKRGTIIACFKCPPNVEATIEVKQKRYLSDLIQLAKEVEVGLVKENLSNFKTEVIVKKSWTAEDLIQGG
jgi:hypothetical protein